MSRATLLHSTIGSYRLTDFLGAGGMGEVYQAVHVQNGYVAAVKVLINMDRRSTFVERFRNEADIQAQLHHPGIARLYEYHEVEGRPCIVMEYV
ncbi:MAG: protein kinase, partial [Rhodothermales bacterium]